LAAWFLYRAKRGDLLQQRTIAVRNEELQLRNEEMSDLMAITAHDLRSPLQGVKHLLDFATPLGGPDRLTTALQTASRSCGDMLGLIGRLLDAYTVGAATELVTADLRDHFSKAAERTQPLALAKNIRLDLRMPAGPATAFIAAGSLAQVLDNLLGNAIKFSPRGGTVTLTLDQEDERWRGEIRDEGPGIPPAEAASVFRKFHHGADGETGAGLGLFIARKLMESMHGTVHYVPQESPGATFRIGFA
jgi:signal transduction histidine kinase